MEHAHSGMDTSQTDIVINVPPDGLHLCVRHSLYYIRSWLGDAHMDQRREGYAYQCRETIVARLGKDAICDLIRLTSVPQASRGVLPGTSPAPTVTE